MSYKVRVEVGKGKNKAVTESIPLPRDNKGNYILSIPNKSYLYYPKIKSALRDANKYMKEHDKC